MRQLLTREQILDGGVPDAAFEVRRADGSIEFDTQTDGYSLLCERVRASIVALGKFDKGRIHGVPAAAFICTAKVRGGNIDLTPSVLTPMDPEMSGALCFGGLMAMRKHDSAGFAVLMRRLRDSGLI